MAVAVMASRALPGGPQTPRGWEGSYRAGWVGLRGALRWVGGVVICPAARVAACLTAPRWSAGQGSGGRMHACGQPLQPDCGSGRWMSRRVSSNRLSGGRLQLGQQLG
ncbi:hypothetical protein PLESTM_001168100 [Pleodorina starrii]|nr:hypothetical protein PLESTM_001168100 [Pleodorina starrii]